MNAATYFGGSVRDVLSAARAHAGAKHRQVPGGIAEPGGCAPRVPPHRNNHTALLSSQSPRATPMNTNAQAPPNAVILEVPEPPEEFGQDGGKFYKAYDAIAEEIDDDMTKSLKEQLDGMLIFVGYTHLAQDTLSSTH